MYVLNNMQPAKIEITTFTELGKKESDVEEMLRQNVDMVCDDEESMLVVGQQVRNEKNGRSDLTAIDNEGNIVLIEIKRDKKDIEGRREAFEFQAIRYAASYATIQSTDTLIQDVFSSYVEKHKSEYPVDMGLTSSEMARRQLEDFFARNEIKSFNERQRIILVASEFDEQTLSAVAWLNSNEVDISCFQMCLYRNQNNVYIDMKKILPVMEYKDFYVNITSKSSIGQALTRNITRRVLPKIDVLLEWKVVKAGDVLIAKGTAEEAVLQPDGQVKIDSGEKLSIQQWLKKVYGWASIQTYKFAVDKASGRSLSDLRQEYMEKQVLEESEGTANLG